MDSLPSFVNAVMKYMQILFGDDRYRCCTRSDRSGCSSKGVKLVAKMATVRLWDIPCAARCQVPLESCFPHLEPLVVFLFVLTESQVSEQQQAMSRPYRWLGEYTAEPISF